MAQKLFSCLFGSRLYGTQTPASDLDLKHLVLPPLGDLLLCRKVENKVKKTNTAKNTRNSADDVDEEFIPVQVFARHFVEGQTYALELAFAVEGTHARQTFWAPAGADGGQTAYGQGEAPPFLDFVRELRGRFLTSNIKAMMGYVVNQASLYSFKGERLNVTRELQQLLDDAAQAFREGEATLADVDEAAAFKSRIDGLVAKYPKYFRRDVYDIGGERRRPCLSILEKTLPMTNSLAQCRKVVAAIAGKYGARADQASASNVDWKATMHALRIVDEGLLLLSEHRLAFPFKPEYASRLLAIKHGEMALDPIREELAQKLETLKDLEAQTDLPPCDEDFRQEFDAWLLGWLYRFYGLNQSAA